MNQSIENTLPNIVILMLNTLPKDLRARLALPWYLKLTLYVLLYFTRIFRIYRYPHKHDPTVENVSNGLYNVYKSMYPIERAFRGSRLEQYFNMQQSLYLQQDKDERLLSKLLSFSAVGDLMKNDLTANSKNTFYSQVSPAIFDADISFANLESTLTTEEIDQTKYQYKEPPKINATLADYNTLKGISSQKYSIFHMANNHILDRGLEGVETTLAQIERDRISHFGINRKTEEYKECLIIEQKGIKIGFIGFTYSVNLRSFPENQPFLVNLIPFHQPDCKPNLRPLKTQIDFAKAHSCDLVVVSLHWGIEYEFYPTPRQLDIAHEIAEYGAHLILGHHTHCIQPYEVYYPKSRESFGVPIFYSLGNLSANKSNPHIVLSLIVRLGIFRSKKTGENTYQFQIEKIIPVFQHEIQMEEHNAVRIELLQNYMDASIKDSEFKGYIKKMVGYADKVLGSVWRSPYT